MQEDIQEKVTVQKNTKRQYGTPEFTKIRLFADQVLQTCQAADGTCGNDPDRVSV